LVTIAAERGGEDANVNLNNSLHVGSANNSGPQNSPHGIHGEPNKINHLSAGSLQNCISQEELLAARGPHFGGSATANRNKTPTNEKTQSQLTSDFVNACKASANSEDQTNAKASGKMAGSKAQNELEAPSVRYMPQDELTHTMPPTNSNGRRGATKELCQKSTDSP
jgi:hypothetical protein